MYSKTTCPRADPELVWQDMAFDENDKENLDPQLQQDALDSKAPVDHGAVEGGRIKATVPFWAKLLIMCVVVFLGAIGYLRSSHQHAQNTADIQDGPSDVPDAAKRKNVPDILLTASAGPNKHLSDFKGKVVLLSFWASWCTPCLIELPSFIDLYQKLSDKGLVILPINVDESEQAATFVGDFWKTKFPFPTFFDPSHEGARVFQVDALPSNFVLDKKGRLVAQGYGANDWSSDASVHFIEQLLKEQVSTTPEQK